MPKIRYMEEADGIPPYRAHPTLVRFHASPKFVRGVMGPFGSGKSSGMCEEVLRLALNQMKGPDGIKKVRVGVIRNTYGALSSTTIKTWTDWFPEALFGPVKYDLPHSHLVHMAVNGEKIRIEAMFFALDKPKDVKKLKSLELTFAWINEASEVLEEAFDMICGRVDRYPKVRKNAKGEIIDAATRACVFMDYNPPNPDHWIYRLAEETTPSNHEYFRQPPAVVLDPLGDIISEHGERFRVNPEAENLEWVSRDGTAYYTNFLQGKEESFIKVLGMGEYGYLKEGRAVYTAYDDTLHFSRKELIVYESIPLTLMMDFGLKCACLIAQVTPRGQIRVLSEIYTEEGLDEMIAMLKAELNNYFPGLVVKGWGDPAGSTKEGHDARTAYEELHAAGFALRPAPLPSNAFLPRKNAVDKVLKRRDGLLIGPRVRMLRAGFLGQYRLQRAATLDRGRVLYKETPLKNSYSHPHDALQYGCLGIHGPISNMVDPAVAAAVAQQGMRGPADREVGY